MVLNSDFLSSVTYVILVLNSGVQRSKSADLSHDHHMKNLSPESEDSPNGHLLFKPPLPAAPKLVKYLIKSKYHLH